MSTSEPSGLPDAQLMAAWANEFFKQAGAPASEPAAAAPLASAPLSDPYGVAPSAAVPVSSPVPQAPPLGPDPSQAGYYFLDQTQGRRFIPVNMEPYTRPLTGVTGPVPKAPAFFAQPLTHPSGVPPVAAALANGVPLAANSGALPVMAGSAEPAWSAAQPVFGNTVPLGPLGTPVPTIGAGLPPVPNATASVPSIAGADFSGLSGGGFPVSVPGIGNDFSTGGLPTHGAALPATGGALPATGGAAPTYGAVPTHGAGVPTYGAAPSLGEAVPTEGAAIPTQNGAALPTYGGIGGFPASNGARVPGAAGFAPGLPAEGSIAPGTGGVTPAAAPYPDTTNAPAAAAAQSGARVYEFQPLFVPEVTTHGRRQYDVEAIRRDFPILQEIVHGKRLVWLDNAATTQKPRSVIDRVSSFYEHENSNVHRAAHTLAARSTDAYENARETVRRFLNAPSSQDIVWVRGTTEAVNLVAQTWGKRNLLPGDEIIISWVEHHSNIVPWQQLCAETGARLKVAPVDDTGQILLNEYERLFTPRTKLASFTHVSNALGTVLPVKEMTDIAHRHGARVLVDGAQAVSHMRVDVQAIGCDFYAFSGHKVFGPTGIGALYGKSEVLEAMQPWQGGGSMIVDVTFDKTVYAPPPTRFEAGTGNIADAVGLGAAIEYVERIGMENIARHEHELLEYGTARLSTIPRLRLIGTAKEKAGVMGFVIDGVPTETIGAALSKEGIAVRSGHHCAQPALRRFGLETTVRPSLALYNNQEDIDKLIATLLTLHSHYR